MPKNHTRKSSHTRARMGCGKVIVKSKVKKIGNNQLCSCGSKKKYKKCCKKNVILKPATNIIWVHGTANNNSGSQQPSGRQHRGRGQTQGKLGARCSVPVPRLDGNYDLITSRSNKS